MTEFSLANNQPSGTQGWIYPIGSVLLFSLAVIGFALTAHRSEWVPWKWTYLSLSGIGLCAGWSSLDTPIHTTFGIVQRTHPGLRILFVSGLGVAAAVGYRRLLDLDFFPSSLTIVAFAAIAVGLSEEILWRGWMQGTLMKSVGPLVSIFLSSTSHAVYKAALFAFPPDEIYMQTSASLFTMCGITFCFGSLLGFFRIRQGTIAGPVAFHVLFDLLVYGECETAPWWIF